MIPADAEHRVMPISRGLLISDVPGDGRHVSLKVSDDEIKALVAFAGILAIGSLAIELDVRPWGKHGFRVSGTIHADVTQACVVTLEPVETQVRETVELKLVPESEAHRYAPKTTPEGEIVIDTEADDTPDFFDGPAIDVGAIAVEFFVLGLDPYPRKSGVEFEPLPDPGAAEASPFAKLAVLKRPETP